MRTRNILAALVLPAMFVACTNDEFEQVKNPVMGENPILKGRAKGQVTLIADKGEATTGADTRVVGAMTAEDGINWLWEGSADKLGAVVVDYGQNGAIVDKTNYPQYAITNYPFEPNITGPSASADFSTPTAVVSGAYMFYNKYDGNNTQRRTISHEINRLTTVSEGTEAGLTQVGTNKDAGGQNFFVSPIIDLAIADGSDIAKPVSLTSVYSILHFKFETDLVGGYYDKGFKINKIVLKTLGKDAADNPDKFMRELTLDPSLLAGLQKKLRKGDNEKLFKTNGAIDAMNLSDEEIRKALNLVNEQIANPNKPIGTQSNGTEDLVYQLDEPIVFTSKDQVKDVMVVLPAGTYHYVKSGLDEYGGKTSGALQMTVYTSEGTYDNYIGTKDMTFMRGKKYNVSRKLIIDGGRTNINLFDPNEGFNIETTADYNYVIEYIKDHFRDFGNSSDWKTPVLNFVDGAEIEVDADHYFPTFPVKYLGNATLKLTGENQTYSFQPENVILGKNDKKEGRPTIEVVEESTTMVFEEDVKSVSGKVDGSNITAKVKLKSNGKVEVAEGKTVNFELLTSNQQLEINKNAVVTANGAVKTAGIVNLKEGAKLNAMNTFENAAVMTIDAKAIATLNNKGTNSGDITVKGLGELTSIKTFTNEAEGSILVESCDLQYMNSKDRAKASFTTLTNAGKITIQKSVDRKGTYGGLMTVTTTLNNSGKISNDGELNVNAVANSGTITLESDPYALLIIKDGTATDAKGNGSIVLADATQYEMFDSYYTGRSNLQSVTGVIETILDQKAYDKVMANDKEYRTEATQKQETAWNVLNQITVNGELKLGAEMANKTKKFILPENASINAQANLQISALVAKGAGTALTGKAITVDGTGSTVPGAGLVDIQAGSELVNNVVLTISPNPAETKTLDVAGKLVNKGSIDTTDGKGGESGDWTKVNRVMAEVSGELVNEGKLSKKAKAKYSGEQYETLVNFVEHFNKTTEGKTTYYQGKNGVQAYYVGLVEGMLSGTTFTSTSTPKFGYNEKIDAATFGNILAKGTLAIFDSFNYIVWANPKVSGQYYILYMLNDKKEIDAVEIARKFDTGNMSRVATGAKAMTYPTTTWFYISENTGTVDLLKAADDDKSWAYGEIFDNTRGTKKGKFNNEME